MKTQLVRIVILIVALGWINSSKGQLVYENNDGLTAGIGSPPSAVLFETTVELKTTVESSLRAVIPTRVDPWESGTPPFGETVGSVALGKNPSTPGIDFPRGFPAAFTGASISAEAVAVSGLASLAISSPTLRVTSFDDLSALVADVPPVAWVVFGMLICGGLIGGWWFFRQRQRRLAGSKRRRRSVHPFGGGESHPISAH